MSYCGLGIEFSASASASTGPSAPSGPPGEAALIAKLGNKWPHVGDARKVAIIQDQHYLEHGTTAVPSDITIYPAFMEIVGKRFDAAEAEYAAYLAAKAVADAAAKASQDALAKRATDASAAAKAAAAKAAATAAAAAKQKALQIKTLQDTAARSQMSTEPTAPPPLAQSQKSSTLLYVGVGVGVLAVAGGAWWFLKKR
jgi:hypothetical protein